MIDKNIGIFKRYTKKPNDIKFGYLYTAIVDCDLGNEETKRTIRVWVPGDYFKSNKRYPVMYMADMQNMIDKYTTAYGAWDMDLVIEKLMENGYGGMILAGVDCALNRFNRMSELCPPYAPNDHLEKFRGVARGDLYGDFIFNQLKPLVDANFRTLSDRANTGVGGSSMGGISSFYLGIKYKELVGFSLCFSPGFLLYKCKTIKETFNNLSLDPSEYGNFFFYCGGLKPYENKFIKTVELVYKELRKQGFNDDKLCYVFDSRLPHHESAWHQYAYTALEWLYFKRNNK